MSITTQFADRILAALGAVAITASLLVGSFATSPITSVLA